MKNPRLYKNPRQYEKSKIQDFYRLNKPHDSETTSQKRKATDPFFSDITVTFSPSIIREVREGEWEIRKLTKFPIDPKTGQKYADSNGQVSCRMCNRKTTQKGLTKHSNSCRNKFLVNRVRFEDL